MREVEIEILGEPVAFARAGRHGSVTFTPAKQLRHMNAVKFEAIRAMNSDPPLDGALCVLFQFSYKIPRSRKSLSRFKVTRPDLDNLVKLVKDSLTGIVYHDDAQVASIYAEKIFRDENVRTFINVQKIEG
jgi:Holliday junction resolvase RusA-like endonuclease